MEPSVDAIIRSRPHCVEVDLFQRAVTDLDPVDALAGGGQLGDDLRRVGPRRSLEYAQARLQLDLHRPRPRQLRGGPGLNEPAVGDDRDPVADHLHLAQQIRVKQHGDAAPAYLLQQLTDDPTANRVKRAGAAAAARSRAPAREAE
jgi:hypothetical protein